MNKKTPSKKKSEKTATKKVKKPNESPSWPVKNREPDPSRKKENKGKH